MFDYGSVWIVLYSYVSGLMPRKNKKCKKEAPAQCTSNKADEEGLEEGHEEWLLHAI